MYLNMSTYLRGNGNDDDSYLLATGHKINLFARPFCLGDPLIMGVDGAFDMYFGVWEVEAEGMVLC